MVSPLDKFNNHVIGSKSVLYDYIPVVSSSGDFSSISGIQTVINSWNNILLTPTRTYVENPEYGSDLYKYIFEPADETTIEGIKSEIQYRLMLYDNRALLTNINISFMNDRHGFVVDLDLEYQGDKKTLTVVIQQQNLFKLEN